MHFTVDSRVIVLHFGSLTWPFSKWNDGLIPSESVGISDCLVVGLEVGINKKGHMGNFWVDGRG